MSMKTTVNLYVLALSPSLAMSEDLNVIIDQLYKRDHVADALILPPSIVVNISKEYINLTTYSVPFLSTPVDFSQRETIHEMSILTSHSPEFLTWFHSLRKLFSQSIENRHIFPYPGFLLGMDSTTRISLPMTNSDWRIILYNITYNEEDDKVVSFQREKLQEVHLR